MTRDHIALAAQYQADVLAGSIPACRWVRLACERNRRDLDRQGTVDFPFTFDAEAGRTICQFAELLPHVKIPYAKVVAHDDEDRPIWETLRLEPWQCWILSTLFGWKRAGDLRRFRFALVLIPRKNGKSTLGAIVALYLFAVEGRDGAEVYSAATTRDQAKIVAGTAWEMVKRLPLFKDYYGVKNGSKTTQRLSVPATGARLEPLSADANSLDGLNIFGAVVDEVHAHKKRDVMDVIDTGTGAQPNSLIFAITTAGVEIGGICHEKLGYLEKLLEGVAEDEAFFGVNYTIDPNDDIRSEVIQRKANPNFGVSVQAADLDRKIGQAQHTQASLNNVLTKHFNVWIRSESSWMTADLWQSCRVEGLTIEALKGFPCWIGMDLGETRDPSSLVLLFKTGEDSYAVIPRIYMPADVAARSPIAQIPGWAQTGVIIITPGNEADYARIEADLLEYFRTLDVREFDFDRRSARLMLQSFRAKLEPMLGRDRAEAVVLDVPQSLDTMDPAMKVTEALVMGKKIQHDGNPAMAWMITNVVVERDHKGQIYPRKAGGKDSHNKIDGAVALFTCLSQAVKAQVAEPVRVTVI